MWPKGLIYLLKETKCLCKHSHINELPCSSRDTRGLALVVWHNRVIYKIILLWFIYSIIILRSSQAELTQNWFSEFSFGHCVLFTLSCSVLTILPLYLSSGIWVLSLKVLVPESPSFICCKSEIKTAGPRNLGFTTIPAFEHFSGGLIVIHAVIVI